MVILSSTVNMDVKILHANLLIFPSFYSREHQTQRVENLIIGFYFKIFTPRALKIYAKQYAYFLGEGSSESDDWKVINYGDIAAGVQNTGFVAFEVFKEPCFTVYSIGNADCDAISYLFWQRNIHNRLLQK